MRINVENLQQLDWSKNDGLLPAIVQDASSGAVLMLGYMNREALRATLERQRVVFFSRSKQRLWEKGETTGHTLQLQQVLADCDRDTLLIAADPIGPTCHTGSVSCFGDGRVSNASRLAFIEQLQDIIDKRISSAPEGSYTAKLHADGLKRIAQKVGEEGLEVALAAAAGDNDAQLVGESADLLFHLLLLLRERGLNLEAVVAELQLRHRHKT
jgi:phosphoribosyl-AMP cyclohydrolase / phosphoribosyl-ATP pyrophosphohydrolase